MSIRAKRFIGFTILLSLGLVLVACQAAATQVAAPTQAPQPIVIPTCPAIPACPTAEPGVTAPFEEAWAASPHNDAAAEAFVHWDETEDKSVPAACATCHSTTGYQDFLGADGSEAGKVDKPAPIGTTITRSIRLTKS